jgi:multidrug efflux pump
MNLSTPFIYRPVGTTLLTFAVVLAGALGYMMLPVAPLPEIDFPTIQVSAALPGASPETMASAVATPLERQFGRIAGITEMTSSSALGATQITLQFDLDRDIDAAARDVQAAINAARGQLPANLPSSPSYRKVNPADAPVMIMSLTSEVYDKPTMYDVAATILQQRLSQVQGVGQVLISGGSSPAVRVDINPTVINHFGLGLEAVRTTLRDANANRPKGQISDQDRTWSISTNDQLFKAREYEPLIVDFRDGAPIRLGDIAKVTDSVENIRAGGIVGTAPAITLIVFRQPGENIIATVDRVIDLLPQLQAQIPAAIKLDIISERTVTIRASVHDVQVTLIISVVLVILVVFLFLRSVPATIISSIAVPVSLIGTFGVMYLCGYSLDNLSLMALAVATGFVVDDAIVVIENITRHLEEGATPLAASLRGAKEIGFTVISISVSLVAVFIPILLMGGVVGRLFREFSITLSVAIAVSLLVSLTTTPMMCARLLKSKRDERHGLLYRSTEHIFQWILSWYEATLVRVLRHERLTMLVMLATIALTVYLYVIVPKGFFPQQDTGRLTGTIQTDQSTSFQAMNSDMVRIAQVVVDDPAVATVTAFTGGPAGGAINTARMFINLTPLKERKVSAAAIVDRVRKKTAGMAGVNVVLQPVQDLRIGGRASSSQYQYTLRSDNLQDLVHWAPKLLAALRKQPELIDVISDQQDRGLQVALTIDRDAAARLGVSPQQIDDALYDAFGQRQVSTIYSAQNQYRVVMGVEPQFWKDPDALKHLYVTSASRSLVPLSTICQYETTNTALSVNHSGQFPSVTISFNLPAGVPLGAAVEKVESLADEMGLPRTMQGSFSGTAQEFRNSLASQPILILAALAAVYIVLGILYESYIHPITILSTLPSAGVGALLALLLCGIDLSVMALIGIVLLIGIVKKNAIMMIDFALDAERRFGLPPDEAILQACIMRFRPITMTTLAALFGALPLALGTGDGSELRRPLGISIVGGLIFSQLLTLYTTPVVYLYLDRFRLWWQRSATHQPELIEVT